MSHCADCPFGVGISHDYPDGDRSKDQGLIFNVIGDDKLWCCHDDPGKVCAGFIQFCQNNGIDYKSRRLLTENYTQERIDFLRADKELRV